MKIADNTFIVTGGCSGLGQATAKELLKQNARVVIADLNEEEGKKFADIGESTGFFKTDVSNEEDVNNLIEYTVSKFGNLKGAVNCAGIAIASRTVSKRGPHSLDSFQKVININLVGSFNVLRLVAHEIIQKSEDPLKENGVIINTASVAAYDGQIGQSAYSASKGGIVGMTLPIARDLSSYGVRVMTIAPGTFNTAMLAKLPQTYIKELEDRTPFPKRLGNPEEYGRLACHIIENEMLNGEVIRIDGALRMPPK